MSIFKSDIALEFKTQQFVKSDRFHFITAPDTYVIYIFNFQHFVYQVILNQALHLTEILFASSLNVSKVSTWR